jgi:DNA mismatch endonuclease (patch repair protein)
MALRRALWSAGVRGYRTHAGAVPGKPDLCWKGRRIAVFVDGAFWHGHSSAFTPNKSGAYWDAKIARNVARDRAADQALTEMGWTVLRFWDFEIKGDLPRCVRSVARAVRASGDR